MPKTELLQSEAIEGPRGPIKDILVAKDNVANDAKIAQPIEFFIVGRVI